MHDVRKLINVQKQLIPDLSDTMKKRYTILHHVRLTGPVGRRTLAQALHMTERVLRAEAEFLESQGLLDIGADGMRATVSGERLLEEMEPLVKMLFGITELEEELRRRFGLKQAVIVAGDSDDSPHVKQELGRAAASILRRYVTKGDIIAVTGGSTMAQIAERMTPSPQFKGCLFVPARGGLGERVELQANTIASAMAKRTGAQYRMLHVPDHLGEEAYQSLIQDPTVSDILADIRKARIVLHGMGDALVMARRRRVDERTMTSLLEEGALAEAFGYYFDEQGRVVHNMPTVGLRIEDIDNAELRIGVAGGASKGRAIAAVMRHGQEDVLVTDEAAAEQMLSL